ncbi:MAG: hypothetical protein GY847_39170 [Proteobacteria bacterium]|nr:hypothetical protein [Pseudomonadota bacterium]
MDNTMLGKITTGFLQEDIKMSSADREVLRPLVERFAGHANSKDMKHKRDLWKALNSLKPRRPVILCDPEMGWNEIITEAQMECKGKLARRFEMDLRKEIFWHEQMRDDKPLDPYFDVPYTVSEDNWGLSAEFNKTEDMGSFHWSAPIKDYEQDLHKIHYPKFNIDWETTNGCLHLAEETFGDIIKVRLKGTWWWSMGVTMPVVFLRGLENTLYDFYEHPDELKELLKIVSKGHMVKLDYLEKNKLLSLNNDATYVGSGGYGNTDELPADDFCGDVRPRDMWGFTDSQETVGVSPKMYEEFIFPFEKPIMERFGLTCYGCCEPLHGRWPTVKKHPNLRRVSCSPWIDHEKMAGYLEDKYIYSWKPSPTPLSMPKLDIDTARKEIREVLEITKGCVVEIIMKDNHTISQRPENLVEWCQIAKEEAKRIE